MVSYRKFDKIVDSDDSEDDNNDTARSSNGAAQPRPPPEPSKKPPAAASAAPELPSSMPPKTKRAVLDAFAKIHQASARGDKKAEAQAKAELQKLFQSMPDSSKAELMMHPEMGAIARRLGEFGVD